MQYAVRTVCLLPIKHVHRNVLSRRIVHNRILSDKTTRYAVAYEGVKLWGAHFEGGRSVAKRPRTAKGRAGVGAGEGRPLPPGGPGVLPPENCLDSTLL